MPVSRAVLVLGWAVLIVAMLSVRVSLPALMRGEVVPIPEEPWEWTEDEGSRG